MNIHLPLYEIGDKIDYFHTRRGIFRYTISEILNDDLITTCGMRILKKNVIVIYKKYGIKVANPNFRWNEKG
jgi:hypothetical protein